MFYSVLLLFFSILGSLFSDPRRWPEPTGPRCDCRPQLPWVLGVPRRQRTKGHHRSLQESTLHPLAGTHLHSRRTQNASILVGEKMSISRVKSSSECALFTHLTRSTFFSSPPPPPWLQKDAFRRDPTSPEVRHLKWMPTQRGTKLLTSGWWGYARKINYTGDWCMGLSWCLLTGFNSVKKMSRC